MTKLEAIEGKSKIEAGHACDETYKKAGIKLDRERFGRDGSYAKNGGEPIGINKLIRLDALPVLFDDIKKRDPNILTTNGLYSISYQAPNSPKYRKGKPFLIGQDLVRGCFCFSSPGHLIEVAKKIPEFAWLLKWTNFDMRLFALAKTHCGVTFRFTVDWVRYADEVFKNAKAMGIDLTGNDTEGVFFAHLSSNKSEEEKNLKVAAKKTIYDYQEELKDADAEQND